MSVLTLLVELLRACHMGFLHIQNSMGVICTCTDCKLWMELREATESALGAYLHAVHAGAHAATG